MTTLCRRPCVTHYWHWLSSVHSWRLCYSAELMKHYHRAPAPWHLGCKDYDNTNVRYYLRWCCCCYADLQSCPVFHDINPLSKCSLISLIFVACLDTCKCCIPSSTSWFFIPINLFIHSLSSKSQFVVVSIT